MKKSINDVLKQIETERIRRSQSQKNEEKRLIQIREQQRIEWSKRQQIFEKSFTISNASSSSAAGGVLLDPSKDPINSENGQSQIFTFSGDDDTVKAIIYDFSNNISSEVFTIDDREGSELSTIYPLHNKGYLITSRYTDIDLDISYPKASMVNNLGQEIFSKFNGSDSFGIEISEKSILIKYGNGHAIYSFSNDNLFEFEFDSSNYNIVLFKLGVYFLSNTGIDIYYVPYDNPTIPILIYSSPNDRSYWVAYPSIYSMSDTLTIIEKKSNDVYQKIFVFSGSDILSTYDMNFDSTSISKASQNLEGSFILTSHDPNSSTLHLMYYNSFYNTFEYRNYTDVVSYQIQHTESDIISNYEWKNIILYMSADNSLPASKIESATTIQIIFENDLLPNPLDLNYEFLYSDPYRGGGSVTFLASVNVSDTFLSKITVTGNSVITSLTSIDKESNFNNHTMMYDYMMIRISYEFDDFSYVMLILDHNQALLGGYHNDIAESANSKSNFTFYDYNENIFHYYTRLSGFVQMEGFYSSVIQSLCLIDDRIKEGVILIIGENDQYLLTDSSIVGPFAIGSESDIYKDAETKIGESLIIYQKEVGAYGIFYFSDRGGSNHIGDGGNDIYDNGNFISTNLENEVEYTHLQFVSDSDDGMGSNPENYNFLTSTVTDGDAYFGTGSTYFTNMYPGMFVLSANNVLGVDYYEINGGLGSDGGGSLTASHFSVDSDGDPTESNFEYSIFIKKVWDSGDPGINHIIIISSTYSSESFTHEYDLTRHNDFHKITKPELSPSIGNSIHQIVVCKTEGTSLENDEVLGIVKSYILLTRNKNSGEILQALNSNYSDVTSNIIGVDENYVEFKLCNFNGELLDTLVVYDSVGYNCLVSKDRISVQVDVDGQWECWVWNNTEFQKLFDDIDSIEYLDNDYVKWYD